MTRWMALLTMAVGLIWASAAPAQDAVRPHWNYEGSAVCPDGYDYLRSLCRSRDGFYRIEGGPGSEGVRPHWNRLGSAVCPEGYDYHARRHACLPQ
jgi:hypothetical protein